MSTFFRSNASPAAAMVNIESPKSREGVAVRDDRRLALIFIVVGVVAVVVFFVLQNTL